MVAQRLVEVHRLQDRRVEAGQQLRGDDEDLERIVGVAEAVEQRLLLVLGRARSASATPGGSLGASVMTTALASSGRMLVELLLVETHASRSKTTTCALKPFGSTCSWKCSAMSAVIAATARAP